MKNSILHIGTVACIAILLAGCPSRPTGKETDVSIRMERTACYGKCPVYSLTIEANGTVTFEGKQFTNTIGKAEAKLDRGKMNELIDEINQADYYSLKSSYVVDADGCPSTATDSPSVNLTITLGGYEKSVRHYHGCIEKIDGFYRTYPANLTNLEKKIDEIAGTSVWIVADK